MSNGTCNALFFGPTSSLPVYLHLWYRLVFQAFGQLTLCLELVVFFRFTYVCFLSLLLEGVVTFLLFPMSSDLLSSLCRFWHRTSQQRSVYWHCYMVLMVGGLTVWPPRYVSGEYDDWLTRNDRNEKTETESLIFLAKNILSLSLSSLVKRLESEVTKTYPHLILCLTGSSLSHSSLLLTIVFKGDNPAHWVCLSAL